MATKKQAGKRIVRLDVENVKRVEAVHIEPNGSTIVIGGENGAGKSSVIDSIAYALGGTKLLPKKPIREGATKGSVKVDLGNVIVTRTFTEKEPKGYLKVESADGFTAKSPQDVLNSMIGQLSFDPLEFATMDDTARLALLRELAGVDFAALDQERATVFSERTEINRTVKQLEARAKAHPRHDDAPEEPVSVSGLMAELDAAEKTNSENAQIRDQLAQYRIAAAEIEERKANLAEQISRMEALLEEAMQEAHANAERIEEMEEGVGKLEDVELAPIREKIASADGLNAKIRANLELDVIEGELAEAREASTAKTTRLGEIDSEKREAIEKAKLPIDGLGFDDDGVTFNGVPFDQISQAEKLRTSVAMGFALNPELRVMLIRDGSLLDENNLALIEKMAEEHDGQIWIERVGNGDEVSVLIVDGSASNVEEEGE